MTDRRQPQAFKVNAGETEPKSRTTTPRKPQATRATEAVIVTPTEIDVFDNDGLDPLAPPKPLKPRTGSGLGTIFFGAIGLLFSLAAGLWTERLIRELFSRTEWLGWLGAGLAVTALVALLIIVVREGYALARLASVETLQKRAADALAANNTKDARAAVADLVLLVGKMPATAAGRRAVVELKGDVIDGADFIRYAEAEILAPLDENAKALILDAAKRVSVVTAVSPRAIVDLVYVFWESARLIRRMSELYGGRPGNFGFFRLARSVLSHLAITGSIAAGDSLVQQLVGHGLAARLSAKLGEGVVNGMMTVRIGIAAMETVRPFPFNAVKRPGISDFLASLTSFTTRKATPDANNTD